MSLLDMPKERKEETGKGWIERVGMLDSPHNVAIKADSVCGKLSIPDNFYLSALTGRNPGGLLILHVEKVSAESLS